MNLAPGEIISKKYRLDKKIGEGATGIVYQAEDILLERIVALKFLRPEYTRDIDQRKRFLNEARIALHFVHESVVPVREIVEWQGTLYLVMDYIPGKTLKHFLARESLTVNDVYHLSKQLLTCLKQAHQRNILHRDIKPSNIMIHKEGEYYRLYILDLGLACVYWESRQEQSSYGTLHYMSPEQLCADPVDHRSDLYSAAVCIYEMLTKQLPVPTMNDDFINQLLKNSPLPPSKINRQLTRTLDKVVLKALSIDPEDRYQSAAELWTAIDGVYHDKYWTKKRISFTAATLLPLAIVCYILFSNYVNDQQYRNYIALATTSLEKGQYQESGARARQALQLKNTLEARKILQQSEMARLRELELKDDIKGATEILEQEIFLPELAEMTKEYLHFYHLGKKIAQNIEADEYREAMAVIDQYQGPNSQRQLFAQQRRRIQLRRYLSLLQRAFAKHNLQLAQKYLEIIQNELPLSQRQFFAQKISQYQQLVRYQRAREIQDYWQAMQIARTMEKSLQQDRLSTAQNLFEENLKKCRVIYPKEGESLDSRVLTVRMSIPEEVDADFIRVNDVPLRKRDGWNAQVIFAEGMQSIEVVYSREDYRFVIAKLSLRIDITPPKFSVQNVSLDMANKRIVIDGRAQDDSRIESIQYEKYQARALEPNFRRWQLEIPLSPQLSEITIVAKDTAGIESKVKHILSRENNAPVVKVSSPLPESKIYSGSVLVEGKIEDPSTISYLKVAGQKVSLATQMKSKWQIEIALDEKYLVGDKLVLPIEASDYWGNRSKSELVLVPEYYRWHSLRQKISLKTHREKIWGMCYSPSGDTLVTASNDGRIIFWELPSYRIGKIIQNSQAATSKMVRITPAIRFISTFLAEFKGQAKSTFFQHYEVGGIWRANDEELEEQQLRKLLRFFDRHMKSLALSPNGQYIAMGHSSGHLRVKHMPRNRFVVYQKAHSGDVLALAYSSDGKWLASGSGDRSVQLWETQRYQRVWKAEKHSMSVTCLAFSHDNGVLATASRDKTIRLWSVYDGKPIAILTGHTSQIEAITFHPKSVSLSSASIDGEIIVWEAR